MWHTLLWMAVSAVKSAHSHQPFALLIGVVAHTCQINVTRFMKLVRSLLKEVKEFLGYSICFCLYFMIRALSETWMSSLDAIPTLQSCVECRYGP